MLSRLAPTGLTVIIEPASDAGLETVAGIRERFASRVIWPCPSPGPCPLASSGKSCFMDAAFAIPAAFQPVVTSRHRRLKFAAVVLSASDLSAGLPDAGPNHRVLRRFEKKSWGYETISCNGKTHGTLLVKSRGIQARRALERISSGDLLALDHPEQIKLRCVTHELPRVIHSLVPDQTDRPI